MADQGDGRASTSAVTLDAAPDPTFYSSANAAASPSVSQIRTDLPHFSTPSLRVSRVGQLDSSLLDRELETILRDPVWKALELVRGSGRVGWEPEVLALLRLAVLRYSVWEGGATYGAKLQNLRWRNEWAHLRGLQSTAKDAPLSSSQTSLYTALTVVPPYLHSRVRDYMLSSGWADHPSFPFSSLVSSSSTSTPRANQLKRLVWDLLARSEQVWATLGLLNFLVFLYDGRYRTLIERLLGMRLVYAKRAVTRNVSFEFLNRQLVWEAMTEFLLFLMPLINLRRVRIRLTRLLTTTRSRTLPLFLSALPSPLKRALHLPTDSRAFRKSDKSSSSSSSSKGPAGPYAFLPLDICPICFSLSTAPPTSLPIVTDPSASTAALASLSHDATVTTSSAGTGNPGGKFATRECQAQVPYRVDCCGGLYCYYCLVARMVVWDEEEKGKGDGWSCLRCAKPVRSATRWKGERLEPPEEAAKGKE